MKASALGFLFVTLASAAFGGLRDPVANVLGKHAIPEPPSAGSDRIQIPAGRFGIGMKSDQVSWLGRQFPIDPAVLMLRSSREIALPAFSIDKFEVTNEQYQRFVRETDHRLPIAWLSMGSKSYAAGEGRFPISGVDFHDAEAYCTWAGGRLPTEDEWEKAARGSDGRLWVWGEEWTTAVGTGLSPVGEHKGDASVYGVMDLAGNVSEWVAGKLDAPTEALTKGGNYRQSQPYSFLTAGRTSQPQGNALRYLGFRCAADARATAQNIRILPVTNIDPEGKYGNQLLVYLPEKTRRPRDTKGVLPWKLEVEVPGLPNDRFGLLFELYQNKRMNVTRASFNENNTVYDVSAIRLGDLQLELKVHGGPDYVDLDYTVKNLGSNVLPTTTETCFQNLHAPTFRDHEGNRTFVETTEGLRPLMQVRGKTSLRRLIAQFQVEKGGIPTNGGEVSGPLIAVVSKDRKWVVSTVSMSGPPARLVNNCEYSCIHANPSSSLAPGETKRVRERIYFLQGSLTDLKARYHSDISHLRK